MIIVYAWTKNSENHRAKLHSIHNEPTRWAGEASSTCSQESAVRNLACRFFIGHVNSAQYSPRQRQIAESITLTRRPEHPGKFTVFEVAVVEKEAA